MTRHRYLLATIAAALTATVGCTAAPPTTGNTPVSTPPVSTPVSTTTPNPGIGYTVDGAKPSTRYVVRIAANAADITADIEAVAATVADATGITITIGAPATTTVVDRWADPHEIIVFRGLQCNQPNETGCAVTKTVGTTIVGTSISIAPTLDGTWTRFILLHEFGHAMGLKHYDQPHDGHTQIMSSIASEGPLNTYRSGDLAGLAHQGSIAVE